AHPGRLLGAKGDGPDLVHRRAERADRGEPVPGGRDRLQVAVAEQEYALAAVREHAVEARGARVVQVGVARDARQESGSSDLRDRPAIAGEDPRAPTM